ncbi:HAMP domain-containing protein [Streptomyces sp. BK340]|uniref:cache domain-containing protein n=1 Tax=Streptomyces sp. BK340 TaxID=2572903 RepID=UPI0011ACF9CF|nr:HAMP domain-containing protein [Streptomyces sp. BK340]TVZ76738.1 HAMP domain-containing protein [Streptomyces sp. BK340]
MPKHRAEPAETRFTTVVGMTRLLKGRLRINRFRVGVPLLGAVGSRLRSRLRIARFRSDMPLLGGVRPPIAALLCMLLAVSALTALTLSGVGDGDVPRAVTDSQEQIAADGAAWLRDAIRGDMSALGRSAEALTAAGTKDPVAALKGLSVSGRAWRGSAVVDVESGRQLAARGEQVPLRKGESLPSGPRVALRLASSGSGKPRLLLFVQMEAAKGHGWLLVTSAALSLPPVHGSGRVVQLVNRTGTPLATAGFASAEFAAVDRKLSAAAERAAAADRVTAASGSLLGPVRDGRRTAAGWAAVAPGADGSAADGRPDSISPLGLVVLTSVPIVQTAKATGYFQFAFGNAGTLIDLAVLVTLLLVLGLQRPLLRLHLTAARISGSGSSQRDLRRPVRIPLLGEPARIGRALESLRRQLLHGTAPKPLPVLRRAGSRALIAYCAVLLAAWSGPLLVTVNRAVAGRAVPAQLIADQQARIDTEADRIRRSLKQAQTDLASVGTALRGLSDARLQGVLGQSLAAKREIFRSLYVVNGAGRVVVQVGETPLATLAHPPSGRRVSLVNASGRVPVIAAYAYIGTATHGAGHAPTTLVGEIDQRVLGRLLTRPALGRVWLVDERERILAANTGFRAFETLPQRELAALAAKGGRMGALTDGTDPAVVAGAPLPSTGATAGLKWQLVSSEDADGLDLAAYQAQWRTVLAGLLSLAATTVGLGWLYFVVVRPLRTLAANAERLVAGDRRTVLYPIHHDEIGSVSRSLELIRQQLAEQERDRARGASANPAEAAASWPG